MWSAGECQGGQWNLQPGIGHSHGEKRGCWSQAAAHQQRLLQERLVDFSSRMGNWRSQTADSVIGQFFSTGQQLIAPLSRVSIGWLIGLFNEWVDWSIDKLIDWWGDVWFDWWVGWRSSDWSSDWLIELSLVGITTCLQLWTALLVSLDYFWWKNDSLNLFIFWIISVDWFIDDYSHLETNEDVFLQPGNYSSVLAVEESW